MSNKATMWYIIFYCLFCSIVVPIIFKDNYFTIIITLNFSFVVQIGPRLFVEEKENTTLETILSSPISMKKIFMGKVWFCFSLILAMLYSCFVITNIISLCVGSNNFMEFQVKEVLIFFFLIPVSVLTLSYHATYLSLKSSDSRACALVMIFVTVLYSILPISIFSCVEFEAIVLVIMIAFYLIMNLFIYIILSKRAKEYFNKSIVLTLLSKVM